jgi:hypothetical protein
VTPTPTDADVERVAWAIMVASKAFADSWIDPVAIARAAIAAMPAPSSLHVTDSTAAAIAASNDGPSPFPATGGEKAGTIPEGWRLVPVEPTTEMLCVGSVKMFAYMRDRPTADSTNAGQVWKAMLAAAPPAPASEDK